MHVAVTAVGKDRPGIVAAVSGALFEHGANIEDSRMAILGGHFAMMLIVETQADPPALEASVKEATSSSDLIVSVRRVEDAPAGDAAGEPFALTVYGADHPGIVYRITKELADRNINVTDLATRVVGRDPPVYLMVMELTVPTAAVAAQLPGALKSLEQELGIEISLRAVGADML